MRGEISAHVLVVSKAYAVLIFQTLSMVRFLL